MLLNSGGLDRQAGLFLNGREKASVSTGECEVSRAFS